MHGLPRLPTLHRLTYDSGIRLIQLITAAGLLVYALSALHRGEAGIIGYVAVHTGIQPSAWELAFTFCSGVIFARRCGPLLFSLVTIPLAVYALSGIPLFLNNANVTFAGIAGHLCFWLTVNTVNWIEVWNGRH